MATVADGSWPEDMWAPSAIPYNATYTRPKALSTGQVEGLVRSFSEAAERALKVGFDTI
jgi:2,4-dienoyl-CoA reductase-like NADH-dependent reductase (Old Yellow Enzyme family)